MNTRFLTYLVRQHCLPKGAVDAPRSKFLRTKVIFKSFIDTLLVSMYINNSNKKRRYNIMVIVS